MSQPSETHPARKPPTRARRRHPFWRALWRVGLILVILLAAARLALPYWVRSYVNRTLDQNPLYHGQIGEVHMHLWRGGYTIDDIRLSKTTGPVPVPFFAASHLHLELEWGALFSGKVVGLVVMQDPELNFVDSDDASTRQTGAEGSLSTGTDTDPWLSMIRDLFPFKINTVIVHNGAVHFRAFEARPPVDVYLSSLEGRIENLTNIHDEVAPLVTSLHATALAMDHAQFELNMKLDPFSYRPSFQLALRLVGLDVTQVNSLTRAYGQFDFERGYFDLVVELNAREGHVEGYVKPLFRHLTILSWKDVRRDNLPQFFWEALVGLGAEILKNQPRDQVGTLVPLEGDLAGPRSDLLVVVGNLLRNAFIRAYLPRFEGTTPDIDGLKFKPGSVTDPLPAQEAR